MRIKISLLAVLGLAALTRAGFLYQNWNNLEFGASFMLHAEVARNILDGRGLAVDTTYLQSYINACYAGQRLIDPEDFPPPRYEQIEPLYNSEAGYGILLAGIWKVTGSKRWWTIRVLQVLIDILMCWIVYRIASRVFNEPAALTAALLYALFLPGIEMAVRPHRDIWVSYLFLFSVFLLLQKDGLSRNPLHFILVGISVGIVAWMRSTVVLFAVFTSFALFFLVDRKSAIRLSGILLGGFLLILAPMLIRNYVVFEKPMATRGAFWHSFWGGVGQMPNPYGLHEDDREIAALAQKFDSTVHYGTEAYEQVLRREAFKFIGDHPVWYVTSVMRRAFMFVFPKLGRALFFQDVLPEHRAGLLNKTLSSWLLILIDAFLSSLFLAGMWLLRKRWKLLLILMLPYLYTWLTLSPFYVTGRNIANVYPTVLILSSLAIVTLWERWKASRLGKRGQIEA